MVIFVPSSVPLLLASPPPPQSSSESSPQPPSLSLLSSSIPQSLLSSLLLLADFVASFLGFAISSGVISEDDTFFASLFHVCCDRIHRITPPPPDALLPRHE